MPIAAITVTEWLFVGALTIGIIFLFLINENLSRLVDNTRMLVSTVYQLHQAVEKRLEQFESKLDELINHTIFDR